MPGQLVSLPVDNRLITAEPRDLRFDAVVMVERSELKMAPVEDEHTEICISFRSPM